MTVNKEELNKLSLADLIAILSRANVFYGFDIYQYEEVKKAVQSEIHLRVTNIFIF